MVKIVLRSFGEVPEDKVKDILMVIEKCYNSLKPHEVEILDLLLFTDSSAMRSFYSRERLTVGVASEGFEDRFIAMHDAWKGTPRIAVCVEEMAKLPKLVQVGALRHEVGHSVLHGSMEYYIFPVTEPLMEASRRLGLSGDYSFNLLYLVSIAVKDFEVTRLLLSRGYVKDQIAYSEYVLKTSEEDLAAWKLSKGNSAGMALCLAGRLKDAACLAALQSRLGARKVAERIRGELSYLPDPILRGMLEIVKKFPQEMAGDTFRNVNRAVEMLVEDMLKPLFRN
jgi:hypothetical protein